MDREENKDLEGEKLEEDTKEFEEKDLDKKEEKYYEPNFVIEERKEENKSIYLSKEEIDQFYSYKDEDDLTEKAKEFDRSSYNDEEIKSMKKNLEDKKLPEEIYLERKNNNNNDNNKGQKKKKSFRGSNSSYIILALVAAIIGGALSGVVSNLMTDRSSVESGPEVTINPESIVDPAAAVAEKAMKSVVGITTVERQQIYGFLERDVQGVGSGVIVDPKGYILTNSHVVSDGNATEIKALLYDGETKDAKLLWNDPTLDLAVVKIEGDNYPVAELADSEELRVGETAIAIGNPLGLEFQRTVTQGIISGLNRSIQIDENNIIDDLIQTDASINQGNSGGPLLNKEGKVIGINTAKIGSAEGLGFSIPINTAKPIVKQVIETGTHKTVALGIKGYNVDEYQAILGVDLEIEKGVLVLELDPGPAEKAGVQVNDVIIKIDDKEVSSMQNLKKELYTFTEADTVTLKVIRNGEEVDLQVDFSNK